MRTVIAAAAACVWMSPAMAGAQASDAELTRQGLELRRARRDAQALDTFRRAYAIKPAPRTLAQIALAEQALGRWVQAESDLVKALDFSDDPWMRERRAQLLDGLADIRAHLGWLDVLCDTPGASLWINGEPLGALKGKPVRVEAGTVVLEVRAEGYLSMRRTSAVEAGGVAREDVHLVETAREPVPARPEPPTVGAPASATERDAVAVGRAVRPGDAWLRDAGYVWLGAGALAIGAGTYFGVRTIQEKNDRNQACPDPTFCQTPGGVTLDREARVDALRSTAWFVAALVGGATGGALLWLSRPTVALGVVPGKGSSLRLAPQVGADRALATVGIEGEW